MAELTAKGRNALPDSAFAGAGRSYPVQDRTHAIAAKSRAHAQFNKGALSAASYHSIVARANRRLGKSAKTAAHG